MTQSGESATLSADAQAVLDWLREDIARGGGTGRRPSKIQLGLGWYLEDEKRVGPAILELVDAHLVALHYVQGMTALGPYVCPLLDLDKGNS